MSTIKRKYGVKTFIFTFLILLGVALVMTKFFGHPQWWFPILAIPFIVAIVAEAVPRPLNYVINTLVIVSILGFVVWDLIVTYGPNTKQGIERKGAYTDLDNRIDLYRPGYPQKQVIFDNLESSEVLESEFISEEFRKYLLAEPSDVAHIRNHEFDLVPDSIRQKFLEPLDSAEFANLCKILDDNQKREEQRKVLFEKAGIPLSTKDTTKKKEQQDTLPKRGKTKVVSIDSVITDTMIVFNPSGPQRYFQVPAGATLEISTQGTFSWDQEIPGSIASADGAGWTPRQRADDPHQFPFPDRPIVGLICRIGPQVEYLGSKKTIVVQDGGLLEIDINERQLNIDPQFVQKCYADNQGELKVRIKVTKS